MTSARAAEQPRIWRTLQAQPYLFALILLLIAIAVNGWLQPNFFRPAVLSGNLRTYLPLILLAVGQTVVIIGGGVDLSVGAIVSLVNVVMVSAMGQAAGAGQVATAILLGLAAGTAAGAFNGLCVTYLRFQPIVTTFASSFVFSGLALAVMPSPGGMVPPALMEPYRANPLGVPLTVWVVAAIILLWIAVRATRYGRYLYAVGGQPMSAYVSGVPVARIRFSTYIVSGFMAALTALALVLSTGTGDPLIGGPMTLGSIVAVVLGGTRLSGGQGSVAGSVIGVLILGLIRSIIFFANVPTWWQTLVDGIVVVLALAGPGLVALLRRRRV